MSTLPIIFAGVEQWATNNWFNILGVVIPLAISYIWYRWQKREKSPRFAQRSVNLIANATTAYPNLQVHYKGHGQDLDNLSVAIFAFWNAGRETIRGADITSADPLVIRPREGVTLLGASLIASNNIVSNVKCEYNKNHGRVVMTFEYLDQDQGFVVELLHTGRNKDDVMLTGTFIGGGKAQDTRKKPFRLLNMALAGGKKRSRRQLKRRLIIASCIPQIVAWIALCYMSFGIDHSMPVIEVDGRLYTDRIVYGHVERSDSGWVAHAPTWMRRVEVSMGIFLLISSIIFLLRLSENRLPRGLEAFDEHPFDKDHSP